MTGDGSDSEEDYIQPSESEEEYYVDDEEDEEPVEPPQLTRVRALADPELQKYLFTPPGEDMSVIYVAVNAKDGKAYVGKHSHGVAGLSVNRSRKLSHESPTGRKMTYFSNAMRKHGKHCFQWFILWHGSEEDEDEAEQYWISPRGLHTFAAHGGHGYNLRTGGEGGGKMANSSVTRMKETRWTEEKKSTHSAKWKQKWDDNRESWIAAFKEAQNRPSVRALNKLNTKAQWEDQEVRDKMIDAMKKAHRTPESRAKQSAIAKGTAKTKKKIDPEYYSRKSTESARNMSKEKIEKKGASTAAVWSKKRDAVLAQLEGDELEKKLKELEKNQRNVETKRKKIAALKSIGGLFEFATEKSIPQAIRLGYVFRKCPDGRYECIAPLQ